MSKTARVSTVVTSRYALALIDLAQEKKALDAVEKDLHAFRGLVGDSEEFRAFIASPVINTKDQVKALEVIVKKSKCHAITGNFLYVLAENNRLYALVPIIDAFDAELQKRRGQITVDVQVAQDLNEDQRQALTESLSKATGSEVFLNVQIKPEILGGVVVTVGSHRIDDSVLRKLERLSVNMKKPINENMVSANQNVERA